MDVIALEEKQYCVAVLGTKLSGKTECDVLDYMENENAGSSSLLVSLASIFERYARDGRHGVTKSMFHEVSKNAGIWQFTKGNHRIFCFRDPDEKRLILLTHGNRKTSQKVNKIDVRRAVAIRDSYLAEKEKGNIRRRTIAEVLEENSRD